MAAIRHEEPQALGRLAGNGLHPIIVRCLSKDPASGFPSAHELLLELKKLQREPLPLSRRKAVWVGALAVAAGLVAIPASIPRAWRGWLPNSGRRLTSLAVLPLTNLSNDPEEEYFADG